MPFPKRNKIAPLQTPWPVITNPDGTERENPVDEPYRHLGHPTAQGRRDPGVVRRGGESPGNGVPGTPKIRPGRRKPGAFGGGFGSSPINDSDYDGPYDF